ncbi:MAG: hypothetical protein IJZ66_00325 [Oscillibacter sp.]|nr:hypothetical protein [Oscillibacter sp.]
MKKNKIMMWIALIAGSCIFGAVLAVLGVEGNARTVALVAWCAVIVTVYGIVTMKSGRKTVSKMMEANRLFTEEHDVEGYIAALNALVVEEKDNYQAQQILHINLCAAYCAKQDYAAALEALETINPKKLNKANAAFYWVNLALCNFYLGNDAEGMRIVDLQKAAFTEMRSAQQTGPALAFLEIFELLHQGEQEDAAALLETARATWENESTAKEFALVAEKVGVELQPLPEKAEEE